MYFGLTEFKCDNCGHKFKAPSIEYNATAFLTPPPCPKCGKRHTCPSGLLGTLNKSHYRKIWEQMDKDK